MMSLKDIHYEISQLNILAMTVMLDYVHLNLYLLKTKCVCVSFLCRLKTVLHMWMCAVSHTEFSGTVSCTPAGIKAPKQVSANMHPQFFFSLNLCNVCFCNFV